MITFKQFLAESINDKGLFKAIFVIGIPGGGKSYTVSRLTGTISPRIVNTDKAAEFLSKKWNKPVRATNWSEFFQDTSKRITVTQLANYMDGMLPLFVDGTSNDVSNVLHRIGILESLGYDIGIVSVICPLDVAKKRAKEREKEIGREVDEEYIEHVASTNKENAAYLKNKVDFFQQITNSEDELGNKEISAAFKSVQSFFEKPIVNPIGRRIIEQMKEEGSKMKYLSDGIMERDELIQKISGWYR